MAFFAIVMAMIGARIVYARPGLGGPRWGFLEAWLLWVRARYADHFPYITGLVAVQVVAPVLGAWLIVTAINSLFGLLGHVITWCASVVVLIWVMGAARYQRRLNDLLARIQDDDLPDVLDAFHRKFLSLHKVHRESDLVEILPGAFVVTVLRHQFAPIFWFLVFGIPGALLYLIVRVMGAPTTEAEEAYPLEHGFCHHWLEWLDWVPARLVAVSVSFAGYVGRSTEYAMVSIRQWGWRAEYLLNETTWAALGLDHADSWDVQLIGMRRLPELYLRVVWVWAIVLALFEIARAIVG